MKVSRVRGIHMKVEDGECTEEDMAVCAYAVNALKRISLRVHAHRARWYDIALCICICD